MELLLDVKGEDVVYIESTSPDLEIEEETPLLEEMISQVSRLLNTDISVLAKLAIVAVVAVIALLAVLAVSGVAFGIYALLSALLPMLPVATLTIFLGIMAVLASVFLLWVGYTYFQWQKSLPNNQQEKNIVSKAKDFYTQGKRLLELD